MMSGLSKEERCRYEGADWALRMVEENGLEYTKNELQRRGIYGIPLKINRSDFNNMYKNVMYCVLLTACCTLRDEFDFGKERLNRYIQRFNIKAECLRDKYVDWKELQQTIKEETGILFPLPEV